MQKADVRKRRNWFRSPSRLVFPRAKFPLGSAFAAARATPNSSLNSSTSSTSRRGASSTTSPSSSTAWPSSWAETSFGTLAFAGKAGQTRSRSTNPCGGITCSNSDSICRCLSASFSTYNEKIFGRWESFQFQGKFERRVKKCWCVQFDVVKSWRRKCDLQQNSVNWCL